MKGDVCRMNSCSVCCHETEMELTLEDIDRISALGRRDFMVEKNGSRILRNIDGHCIFLDGNDCTIYEHRPKGCTLYPLVMSMPERRPVLDEDCPYRHLFAVDPDDIRELSDLIDEMEG